MDIHKRRKELLVSFLNKHGYSTDVKGVSGFWDRYVDYTTYYNPMGCEKDIFDTFCEKVGNIRYSYTVDDIANTVIRTMYIYRPEKTRRDTEYDGWDIIDINVYPMDKEIIPIIDDTIKNSLNSFIEKREDSYCIICDIEDRNNGWVEYTHKYRLSICGQYVVRTTTYYFYGPEDPDNNYQQICQKGSDEPKVYRFEQ